MARARYKSAGLGVEDAESLFDAQNQLAADHVQFTEPYFTTTFEEWKTALGYPPDDAKRLQFIQCVPSYSTKFGDKLHCLKLTCSHGKKTVVAGFIEFEIRQISDPNMGEVREVYIRNLIVRARMRGQGCGTMLYRAMLDYLGTTELDIIRLEAAELNQAATRFYFKLGFRITQTSVRCVGESRNVKLLFLCMQKLQGEKAHIALQDMPHIFKGDVIGEIVNIVHKDKSGEEKIRQARVETYDPHKQRFTTERIADGAVHDVCLNQLFSVGRLTFEKPPSVKLNEIPAPVLSRVDNPKKRARESSPAPKAAAKNRAKAAPKAAPQAPEPLKLRRAMMRVFDGGKIGVGLQLGELGYIVCDKVSTQCELTQGDVIVAVRGKSLLRGSGDDVDAKEYRTKVRSTLQHELGNTIGVAEVVLGSLDNLSAWGWLEVNSALQNFIKESTAAADQEYNRRTWR